MWPHRLKSKEVSFSRIVFIFFLYTCKMSEEIVLITSELHREKSIQSEIISPSTKVHILKTFTYRPIAGVVFTNTTVINSLYKQ